MESFLRNWQSINCSTLCLFRKSDVYYHVHRNLPHTFDIPSVRRILWTPSRCLRDQVLSYHIIYPRNSELVFALNLFKLQFLYLFISTIRASFLVYIILIDFTIFCEEYQVWSLLLYNLLHLFLFLELFPFQIISLSLFVRMICILNSAF